MRTETPPSVTYYTYFTGPIGPILLTSDGAGLTGVYMEVHKHGEEVRDGWLFSEDTHPLQETKRQLAAYFDGTLTEFDLPLAMRGTPFQLRVWEELVAIPYGVTISYGELARRVGNPNASRAVGLANGHNPISIIVPCHRVIGSDGKLTGYGGGLPRKAACWPFEIGGRSERPTRFPPLTEEAEEKEAVQFRLDFASSDLFPCKVQGL